MSAMVLMSQVSVIPGWALWIVTLVAVVAAGIGPCASWIRTKRIARGLVVAGALAVFVVPVLVIINCWGLPDWLCYLV